MMQPAQPETLSSVRTDTADVTGAVSKIVLGAACVLLAWAVLVPLDSAVVAQATLTSQGSNLVLQHYGGGTIKTVHAKSGDKVEEGGLILELNPLVDQAKVTGLRARMAVLDAIKARLLAEKADRAAGLAGADQDGAAPVALLLKAEQAREFEKGRKSVSAQLLGLESRAEGERKKRAALADQKRDAEQQLELLRSQVEDARKLAESGYIARQQVWDLELRALQQSTALARITSEADAAASAIDQAKAEMDRVRMDDQRLTSQKLTEVLAEMEQIRDELSAAESAREQTAIRAPAAGYLVHFTATTPGGVVRPGDTVGEIVPSDAPLEAKGRVPVTEIASVSLGQEAEVQVSALDARIEDAIPAKVTYVAADATTDERTGERFFEVKALLDASAIEPFRDALVPGMGAQLFVKGQARTFGSYLIQPFVDGLSRTFRETG